MSKRFDRIRSSLTLNMIGAVVVMLALFGVIVSMIGFASFSSAFKREYSTSTYHMADTATTLINGDHIDDYLRGDEEEEFLRTRTYLDAYCKAIHVSLIYVIDVDRSDYKSFVSVFNLVNNSVDNTTYEPWELGYRRETSTAEYEDKYEAIYNKEVPYETVYRRNTSHGVHPHITTLVPVKGSDGEVTAILCMQRPMQELRNAMRPYLRNILVAGVILAVVVSVLGAMYIRRQFVVPIRKISGEATRFSKDNKIGESLEKISRIKDINDLAVSIDTMEEEMVRYINNLTAVTSEKERISTELSLASRIQENSVPNEFPAFCDRQDFDIFATMKTAKEVGGDFYNFFLIDDDHLALIIGDVSGKGVPAALFMMVTNILVSFRTRAGGKPSQILKYVNEDLCKHNRLDMFVTIWLGIVELSTGKVICANAGHEDPAIYRKQTGSFELFRTKHGFVAGGLENTRYNDEEFTLDEGDRLFLYTDGIPEATDADNRLFSVDRMMDVLNNAADADCEGLLRHLHKAVDEFVKDAPQFDDITMLCFERRKNG